MSFQVDLCLFSIWKWTTTSVWVVLLLLYGGWCIPVLFLFSIVVVQCTSILLTGGPVFVNGDRVGTVPSEREALEPIYSFS